MNLTYEKAGVSIDAGNELVKRIKKMSPVIGGFAGLFPLKGSKYLLSSSTDGVGTKLKIAFIADKHDTIGIDLVAMNVNDVICSGAKPLIFLDYFACSKLDVDLAENVIKGIVEGCKQADCVLLGGETAEMPGFYQNGEYDLAGFAVGVVEKGKQIDGSKIKPGDVLIGLPSTGPHSNGYSLIRKVFDEAELKVYSKQLLAPTKIYVKEITKMLATRTGKKVSALAHVTGGGFFDNLERLLPDGCRVNINTSAWDVPEIFKIIQKKGSIEKNEMYRTFNMGIGMIVFARREAEKQILKMLKGSKVIGNVTKEKKGIELI